MADADPRPKGSVSRVKVLENTGRDYDDWVRILDAFDVATNGHAAAAKHLLDDLGVKPWYSQAITVRYELEKGLRTEGQTDAKGLHVIQLTKTIAAEVPSVYQALSRSDALAAWLADEASIDATEGGRFRDGRGNEAEVRVATADRRLRLQWEEHDLVPASMLAIELEAAGSGRTRVRWTATKVADRTAGEAERGRWKAAFERLASHVTG